MDIVQKNWAPLRKLFTSPSQWRSQEFVLEGSVTDVVRFQTSAILHEDHFDVTGQFLVYYNRI